MNIKKTLLLASMALAVIAFAVPATASATPNLTWTHNDVVVGANDEYTQKFEGDLSFTVPTIHALGINHRKYACEVTVAIKTKGRETGDIEVFSPTTETCEGEGVLAGCEVKHHTTNLPGWGIHTTTTDLVVKNTTSGQDITIFNEYEGCAQASTHLVIGQVTITPHLDGQGTIETLTIEGSDTTGLLQFVGELHLHDGGPTLGLG